MRATSRRSARSSATRSRSCIIRGHVWSPNRLRGSDMSGRDIDESSENVLSEWTDRAMRSSPIPTTRPRRRTTRRRPGEPPAGSCRSTPKPRTRKHRSPSPRRPSPSLGPSGAESEPFEQSRSSPAVRRSTSSSPMSTPREISTFRTATRFSKARRRAAAAQSVSSCRASTGR